MVDWAVPQIVCLYSQNFYVFIIQMRLSSPLGVLDLTALECFFALVKTTETNPIRLRCHGNILNLKSHCVEHYVVKTANSQNAVLWFVVVGEKK